MIELILSSPPACGFKQAEAGIHFSFNKINIKIDFYKLKVNYIFIPENYFTFANNIKPV